MRRQGRASQSTHAAREQGSPVAHDQEERGDLDIGAPIRCSHNMLGQHRVSQTAHGQMAEFTSHDRLLHETVHHQRRLLLHIPQKGQGLGDFSMLRTRSCIETW